jgi:hypothetical protein
MNSNIPGHNPLAQIGANGSFGTDSLLPSDVDFESLRRYTSLDVQEKANSIASSYPSPFFLFLAKTQSIAWNSDAAAWNENGARGNASCGLLNTTRGHMHEAKISGRFACGQSRACVELLARAPG